MSCSIFGDKFAFQMTAAGEKSDPALFSRSALQNPDIQRAQLGALLRTKAHATQSSRPFWQGLMAAQVASCANSNT